MSEQRALVEAQSHAMVVDTKEQFVTMHVGQQMMGISVHDVRDIITKQKIATIPLSNSVIAGAINLRGRIVTVLDMRKRLGLEPSGDDAVMHIVVEIGDELFSLMVDSVGDVMRLPVDEFERSPVNLSEKWRELSSGVCQLDKELLVILDTAATVSLKKNES